MTTAEFLLARKLGKGSSPSIVVEALNVTSNGTYSEEGKAYSPVTVSVQPPANSYQLKSITTPTSLATFEASEMPMPSLKVSVEAKQEGSGTPSPENVRPISGWSEVKVSDVGKNMIDDNLSDLEQGTIDGSYGSNSSSNSRVRSLAVDFDYDNIANANYRLTIPNGYQIAFRPYKEDGSYVFTDSTVIGFISSLPRTWLGKGIKKMRFVFAKTDYSDITPADIANIGYQLEKGSTATTYEPYKNQTTTISLPQTVYGGEVDVVNGSSGNKLTHQFETISGGITTTDSSGNLFVVKDLSVPRINDYNTVTPYIISNYLTPYSVNDLRANAVFGFTQYGKRLYVRLGDEITTVEDANAYLASNNLQIKYELETPTTFTTQPTPIKSLNGLNNLSVDCGEVIEGEYFIELGGN